MLRRLPHPSCRSVACATWTVTIVILPHFTNLNILTNVYMNT